MLVIFFIQNRLNEGHFFLKYTEPINNVTINNHMKIHKKIKYYEHTNLTKDHL